MTWNKIEEEDFKNESKKIINESKKMTYRRRLKINDFRKYDRILDLKQNWIKREGIEIGITKLN